MADSSTSSPLVSIIIPVYNGERHLRESLDSIVAQTYPRTEVLVMDDASTDGTPSIVASYGDRVKYYRQLQNRGQFENVNDGISMAQGEYVAVYHADDIYHPTIVEREVTFLQRYPEAGAVFCQDIFIDPRGHEYARLQIPPEVRGGHPLDYSTILNSLLKYKNRFLRGPSSMVRASVYRDVGTYRGKEFRIASDLEMWVRIARKYSIGILEEYLFRYRHGHGNSTQNYYHLRTEPERYFQIIDMYLDEGGQHIVTPEAFADYEAHRAEDRLMLAINHYILGRLEESQSILRQVQPWRILGGSRIQRGRLLVLFLALNGLVRMPRISLIANLFYRRWHVKRSYASNCKRG